MVFRNDPVTLDLLAIAGSQPSSHVKWMEMVKKFYRETTASEEIKSKLNFFKITEEELSLGSTLITGVETTRADYLREVGESEDTTKQKDAALAQLDDWMGDFYAVAKIALEDHPQLLESLGKSIKS